jgi:hypothetical protein
VRVAYAEVMQPQDNFRFQLRRHNAGIFPALVFIGIGALFLLNNLNIFHIDNWTQFWPVLLIAAGLVRLVESQFSAGRLMGGVMIGVGGLLLTDTLGYLRLNWDDMWPLALIGLGILMLWSRLTPGSAPWQRSWSRQTPVDASEMHEGTLNEFALFGGVDRKVTTDDFRGGQISATFGGVEIDLRRAGMRGDSAAIEVNATFGGVELKVPLNWIVVSRIVAIFGGFENKSAEPPQDMPGVKRLYLKGSAVFGGVHVKN